LTFTELSTLVLGESLDSLHRCGLHASSSLELVKFFSISKDEKCQTPVGANARSYGCIRNLTTSV
jgi:hypothetical protein